LRFQLGPVPFPTQQPQLDPVHRTHGPEHSLSGHRGQPLLGQIRPPGHPAYVANLPAGRDGVAIEDAGHERIQPALQDRHHRLIEQRQPVRNLARHRQRTTFAIHAHRHQAWIVQPASEVTDLASHFQRLRRPAGHQVGIHPGQRQQEPVDTALRDTLKQAR
jgi:hypothetical protein